MDVERHRPVRPAGREIKRDRDPPDRPERQGPESSSSRSRSSARSTPPALLVGRPARAREPWRRSSTPVRGRRPPDGARRLRPQHGPEHPEGILGPGRLGGAWVLQARNGTLLLEHIHCLSLPVQKELVSVLRNNAHGLRLICTSNEDLEKLMDEGRSTMSSSTASAALPVRAATPPGPAPRICRPHQTFHQPGRQRPVRRYPGGVHR